MSYISNAPKIRVRRWLAVAAAAASLAAPATALGVQQPDLPRGIIGATNDDGGRGDALQGGLAHRTKTELSQRVATPHATSADDDFSWADAGIGAGAVAAAVALTGAGLAIRRRTQAPAQPAV